MIRNAWNAQIEIMIVEPNRNVRLAIKAALLQAGFSRTRDADCPIAAARSMADKSVDVALIDTEMKALDVEQASGTGLLANDTTGYGLIRAMRKSVFSETCPLRMNPFSVILATTWRPEEANINRIAASGADGILIKPISTNQIIDRISILAKVRKDFVVTQDYFGPDRRGGSRPSITQPIQVPNTLKAKLGGGALDPRNFEAVMGKVTNRIRQHRCRHFAMRVAFVLRSVLETPTYFTLDGEHSSRQNDRITKTIVTQIMGWVADLDTQIQSDDPAKIHCGNLAIALKAAYEAPHVTEADISKACSHAKRMVEALCDELDDEDVENEIRKAVEEYRQARERKPAEAISEPPLAKSA